MSFKKLIFQRERLNHYLNLLHAKHGHNIDKFTAKLVKKYESDKYYQKERKMGYEPRKPLYDLLLQYAEAKGMHLSEESDFLASSYRIGSYKVALYVGQGAFIHVSKYEPNTLRMNCREIIEMAKNAGFLTGHFLRLRDLESGNVISGVFRKYKQFASASLRIKGHEFEVDIIKDGKIKYEVITSKPLKVECTKYI